MALVPATITVDFVSNYAGQHRVCWRIQGSGDPYTCTTSIPATHVVCPGGGNPCQFVIDIQVDNETCEEITYEGYVQAACQTEASLVDRIPFTVVFTPSPACLRIPITCDTNGVHSIQITSGGSGYADPADIGGVITIAGDGAGATAEIAAVVAGAVAAVNILTPGSGYSAATATFPAPVGGGVTAEGDVVLLPCGGFEYTSCAGAQTVAAQIEVGETGYLCSPTEPLVTTEPFPSNMTEGAADGNCLCDCQDIEIENVSGKSIDIYYVTCGDGTHSSVSATPGITALGCVVTGSVFENFVEDPLSINVNVIGPCDGVV